MSVLMVFFGPHLPLAFHFVRAPGGRRLDLANEMDLSVYLFASPQVAAVYSTNRNCFFGGLLLANKAYGGSVPTRGGREVEGTLGSRLRGC